MGRSYLMLTLLVGALPAADAEARLAETGAGVSPADAGTEADDDPAAELFETCTCAVPRRDKTGLVFVEGSTNAALQLDWATATSAPAPSATVALPRRPRRACRWSSRWSSTSACRSARTSRRPSTPATASRAPAAWPSPSG